MPVPLPVPWIFEWYTPDQDLRPLVWRRAIGAAPVNVIPPVPQPFLISNPYKGMSVRFRSLVGASGPQYVPVNQEIPFEPGSRLKFINVNEAQVDLKVLIQAGSQVLLWAKMRELPYIFNPLRGTGTLKVTNPAGQQRFLSCTCISGFKLDESTLQEKSVEAVLSFWANDPYWYSAWNEVTISYTTIAEGALPILPSTLVRSPGDLAGGYTVSNLGDVNSKLVAVISGPYKNPILSNATINIPGIPPLIPLRNPVINLSNNGGINTILANPVTIDFLNKNILVSSGVGGELQLGIRFLTTDSNFWVVKPGNNNIQFKIERPNPATTLQETKLTLCTRSAYSTMI